MGDLRKDIISKFETLQDIDGIELTINEKTIYVQYNTIRSLDFKFVWSADHFIGYFLDKNEKQSQAVIALWNSLEAVHFVAAYCLLLELRAGRK